MHRLLILFALLCPAAAHAAGLTVFAAASLTNAFNDIGTLWRAQGHRITFSFAASSTLAQQIEHGAPADIFASADAQWMDRLAEDRRIDPATRVNLAGNTLVLVERAASLKKIDLKQGADLAGLLGPTGRLAVGDPYSVPAGIYARQALTSLGLWPQVADRLAPADSVRSALLLVSRGEAPAGIVYGTDARIDRTLAVAGTFPADSHDKIQYPVAATPTAGPDAAAFLVFLKTQDARDVLLHYGFSPP